jgi:hypothetical protein
LAILREKITALIITPEPKPPRYPPPSPGGIPPWFKFTWKHGKKKG